MLRVYPFNLTLPVHAHALVSNTLKENFKNDLFVILMTKEPLLPLTVQELSPGQRHWDRCICAYISIVASLVGSGIIILIYFLVTPSIFKGDE